jgi:hypothetical protein
MAIELDEWLKRAPEAPDFDEAPEGWHNFFVFFVRVRANTRLTD